MTARTFLSTLVFALSACSGDEPTDDTNVTGDDDDGATGCAAGGMSVSAGTGAAAVEPLTDGGRVVMVHGPQGGWHIDVAGVVDNTEEAVSIAAIFTDAGGMPVAGVDQLPVRLALVGWSADGCSGEFYGQRIFLDDVTENVTQADICDLDGQPLTLELTVTALSGDPAPSATTTVDVIAVLDAVDLEPCAALE
jgi:hypothetical protein